jgi:thioredoxin-related protein
MIRNHRRAASLFAALLPMSLALFAAPLGADGGETHWTAWDAGLHQAAESKRPVLVDVYTDWCGWCKRMDHDVYSRADVREYLDHHFVTVRLNAESPETANYDGKLYTGRTLAMRFGVSGYPTTIFLRANGEHLVNVPGYVKADEFLTLLRYIGDGHMDRGESFETFQKGAGGTH